MFISQPNLLVPGRTLFICYVHANPGSFKAGRQGELGLEMEVLSGMMVIGFPRNGGWGTGQWNDDFRTDWDPGL